MDYRHINEVNKSYVFLTYPDGKQDRKPTHKKDIVEALECLVKDRDFYNRMVLETRKEMGKLQKEIEIINSRQAELEKYIDGHNEDPLIRRGLADICFKYQNNNKEYTKIIHQLSGMGTILNHAFEKQLKAEKIISNIENTLKLIK